MGRRRGRIHPTLYTHAPTRGAFLHNRFTADAAAAEHCPGTCTLTPHAHYMHRSDRTSRAPYMHTYSTPRVHVYIRTHAGLSHRSGHRTLTHMTTHVRTTRGSWPSTKHVLLRIRTLGIGEHSTGTRTRTLAHSTHSSKQPTPTTVYTHVQHWMRPRTHPYAHSMHHTNRTRRASYAYKIKHPSTRDALPNHAQ